MNKLGVHHQRIWLPSPLGTRGRAVFKFRSTKRLARYPPVLGRVARATSGEGPLSARRPTSLVPVATLPKGEYLKQY